MPYKVTLDLTDGSTVVFDNVEDYDIDDSEEIEDPPEEDTLEDAEEPEEE